MNFNLSWAITLPVGVERGPGFGYSQRASQPVNVTRGGGASELCFWTGAKLKTGEETPSGREGKRETEGFVQQINLSS